MGARYSVRIKDKKSKPAKYDRFVWTADEARLVFGRATKYNPNHRGPGDEKGGEFTTPELAGIIIATDRLGNKVEVTKDSSLYRFLVKNPNGEWSIDPLREQLHQQIVNDMLNGVKRQDGGMTLYWLGGGPASGKSTAIKDMLPKDNEAVVVDPDKIKTMLPEFEVMVKAGDPMAGTYVHEESSMIRHRLEDAAIAGNYNVVVDTTGDNSLEKLTENVSKFRAKGYKVQAYYATVDTDTAVQRMIERGKDSGRYVPIPYLRSAHASVSRVFPAAASNGLFDNASLYDTNKDAPRLVATVEGSKTTIVDQNLWNSFVSKGVTASTSKAAKKYVDTERLAFFIVAINNGVPKESMRFRYAIEERLWDELAADIKRMPKGQFIDAGNELSSADFTNFYTGSLAEHASKKTAGQFGHENVQWVPIKKTNDEKQIVYGEVYAPYVLDTYGEFMTPEDIELMAHRFMRLNLSEVIDTQHDNKPNGSYPVESFIAREGDTEYTPGSWVLGVHIPDAELWTAVKSGLLNGFSFQSLVKPTSVDVEVEAIRDFVGETELSEDHQHTFYVELDEIGNVVGGRTSKGADGHYHEIQWASVTGRTNGHSHRFFL